MCLMVTTSSCSSPLTVEDRTYYPYGIADMRLRSEDVVYKVNIGNILVGLIASETIVIPLYIVLFDIWEPRGLKKNIVRIPLKAKEDIDIVGAFDDDTEF